MQSGAIYAQRGVAPPLPPRTRPTPDPLTRVITIPRGNGRGCLDHLYMAKVTIPVQGFHNVVFVATENDSVYAFDTDNPGPALWHDSLINPAEGITSVPTTQGDRQE